jgi:hypothetical protein
MPTGRGVFEDEKEGVRKVWKGQKDQSTNSKFKGSKYKFQRKKGEPEWLKYDSPG